MKIIYLSPLISKTVLDYIFRTSNSKPSLAVQKFHYLITRGLSEQEVECQIEALSLISIERSSHKKRFWLIPSERDNNIHYHYIPMLNLPILKSISILINSFFQLSLLLLSNRRQELVIICDVLYLPLSIAIFISSYIFKVRKIAILTDVPGIMRAFYNRTKLTNKIYNKLFNFTLSKFDSYVFLTHEMNKMINKDNKPYTIMEGLVDSSMVKYNHILNKKNSDRIILYAGGLFEEYGIKKLIESFRLLDGENLRLHIYGSGLMVKDMFYYASLDPRIVYQGIFPNEVIVGKEMEATLLVNPRPSNAEFTKFSFPSKNLEYMVSGTPLVTTPLPGMPKEYYKYVYLFDDETVQGFAATLKRLTSLCDQELFEMGTIAREFVLKNKNNIIQGKKILDLCL